MHHNHRRGWRFAAATTVALASVVGASVTPTAAGKDHGKKDESFGHIGTFDVRDNGTEVAEIVNATADGRTLVYTDSATGKVGFVDIRDPKNPLPAGTITVGGSPTSVGLTKKYALVW